MDQKIDTLKFVVETLNASRNVFAFLVLQVVKILLDVFTVATTSFESLEKHLSGGLHGEKPGHRAPGVPGFGGRV